MTGQSRHWPHPLVGFLAPLAASPFILVGGGWRFLVLVLSTCCLLAIRGGRSLIRRTLLTVLATFLLVLLGFWPWLGIADATVLGLRMSALVTSLSTCYALLDWRCLTDSLVAHCHLPYPLVDVVQLGHRFIALMRREGREMSTRLRIDAKGSTLTWLVSLPRLVVPMLVASFKVADLTATALEARGFASQPMRTTHHARRPGWSDLLLAVVLLGALAVSSLLL